MSIYQDVSTILEAMTKNLTVVLFATPVSQKSAQPKPRTVQILAVQESKNEQDSISMLCNLIEGYSESGVQANADKINYRRFYLRDVVSISPTGEEAPALQPPTPPKKEQPFVDLWTAWQLQGFEKPVQPKYEPEKVYDCGEFMTKFSEDCKPTTVKVTVDDMEIVMQYDGANTVVLFNNAIVWEEGATPEQTAGVLSVIKKAVSVLADQPQRLIAVDEILRRLSKDKQSLKAV